jgi:mannose-1-phosphate guanylyltransferase
VSSPQASSVQPTSRAAPEALHRRAAEPHTWAVVLAGGVGSRFWPLSTPERPKQLLPLVTANALLVDTLRRMAPLVPAEQTLVLTNAGIERDVARLVKLPETNVIAEPHPAGTAAALAFAASEIARRDGPGAGMICVHADWAVADEPAFRAALATAVAAAQRHGSLVTVGIVPTRPDPGFGYICPGGEVEPGVLRVERFVEKPDRLRAAKMVADGYFWNSGIFAWRVGDFLDEIRALTPEVAPALAYESIDGFFAHVKSISVDVGVLERSSRVLVIPGRFGWDDVGTWGALARVRAKDDAGNASYGTVYTRDSHDNVVHADRDNTVVLDGVSGLVVVVIDGVTLVTTIDRSADLKGLLEKLPAALRDRK